MSRRSFFWYNQKIHMTQKLSQALACFVIGIAYVVILNAYVDIPILRDQIVPGTGADFSDGLAFFFCGIIAYVVGIGSQRSNLVADLMLPTSVLVLFLLMSTRVTAAALGLHIDISILLSGNDSSLLQSADRVLPWGEILSFCLVALNGLSLMVRTRWSAYVPLLTGLTLIVLNASAVLGYVLSIAWLTGRLGSVSVATSALAAPLLVVIGIVFLLTWFRKKRS